MLHLLVYLIFILPQTLGGKFKINIRPSTNLAPALYAFGDSLIDNGNNNWLPTLARANYCPYGLNFPGGVTGRFTNGRTIVDFIAEYLGLPYPPPYASLINPNWAESEDPIPYLFRPNVLTGYNYASASSGILPETGSHLGKCLSLDEQIVMFSDTVNLQLAPTFKNRVKLYRHLSKSIFVLVAGNNDYLNNYLDPLYVATKRYSPPQFAQFLVRALSRKLQKLYEIGARKVIVSDVGPLGCIPSTNKQNICDENTNKIILMFNKQLGFMLKNLTFTLKGSHFILAQSSWLSYRALMNPAKYGLRDSRNPCCSTWLNGTSLCIPEGRSCQNPNSHYFWDGYHPTESVFSLLASQCIHGSSLCVPTNLNRLLRL